MHALDLASGGGVGWKIFYGIRIPPFPPVLGEFYGRDGSVKSFTLLCSTKIHVQVIPNASAAVSSHTALRLLSRNPVL